MFCPVCNGMEQLQAACTKCSQPADDLGRVIDLKGPYSPYESIAIVMRSFMPSSEETGMCSHLCCCSGCRNLFEVNVAECR